MSIPALQFRLAEPLLGPDIAVLRYATSQAVSLRLDDSATASCTLDGLQAETKLIAPFATDLVASLTGVGDIFRGRIGAPADNGGGGKPTTDIKAADYRDRLAAHRIVYGASDEMLVWVDTDQTDIAWALINNTQQHDPMGITDGRPAGLNTRIRDFTATPGEYVGSQIDAVAQLDGGFSWAIDDQLRFQAYYPSRGRTSPTRLVYGTHFGGDYSRTGSDVYANAVRLSGGTAVLPAGPVVTSTVISGGYSGFFSAGESYRYQVAAILPEGETVPGPMIWPGIHANNAAVRLTWAPVLRATGYNVYGRNRTFGPNQLSVNAVHQTSATNATLPNGDYSYAVTAQVPDGYTEPSTKDFTVTNGFALVTVSWDAVPGAISYNIYGRRPNNVGYIGTVAGTSLQDDGTAYVPGAPLPATPGWIPHRIATNVQGLTWTDTGVAAPAGNQADGTPAPVLAYALADDIPSSRTGRWEASVGDSTIITQPQCVQRAGYQLATLSAGAATTTITFLPGRWKSFTTLGLGDMVSLRIRHGRLDVDEIVQCTGLDFAADAAGRVVVTATLGPVRLDIFARYRHVAADLQRLNRR